MEMNHGNFLGQNWEMFDIAGSLQDGGTGALNATTKEEMPNEPGCDCSSALGITALECVHVESDCSRPIDQSCIDGFLEFWELATCFNC